ncbi:MAG TPA: galactose oxidase-like domain-containing protein [Pyrinomonadaceae bacterium]|nr:galactose oxidase-like domain-containing protein [Pyrinomonadaceae bacterium]
MSHQPAAISASANRVVSIALVVTFCLAVLPMSAFAKKPRGIRRPLQTYGQTGKWTNGFFTAATVHLHVLPNGKVLSWTQFPASAPPCPFCRNPPIQTYVRISDPPYTTVSTLYNYWLDLFCSGHSLLPDGRLLITGGTTFQGPPNSGVYDTTIFDPSNNTFTNGSDYMYLPRWYPTNVALANGETLTISGSYLVGSQLNFNNYPQVWKTTGGWRDIPGAATPQHLWLYPWMHLTAGGLAYNSGPTQSTYFINTSGNGSWSQGPNSIYGLRDEGTSVMYEPNKIIVIGGGNKPEGPLGAVVPTNTAEKINLYDSPPTWTPAASMTYRRRHLNATILPNGKVLVTGGTKGGGFNNTCHDNWVLEGEIWDPATDTWSFTAAATHPRLYHSAAVLLPDGRVLVGGTTPWGAGGGCPGMSDQIQQTEIYSPPYLFDASGNEVPRPSITSVQATATYGETITVGKPVDPPSQNISKVTLVRLSSTTHSFNQNQRFNNLSFTSFLGGLNVTMPADGNLCPPGHYMLFIINSAGVPSVASIIKIS